MSNSQQWRHALRLGLRTGVIAAAGGGAVALATVWMLLIVWTDEASGPSGAFYAVIPMLVACFVGVALARSFDLPHGSGFLISPAGLFVFGLLAWFTARPASALALSGGDADAVFWIFVAIGWMTCFAVARFLWPPRHATRRVLSVAIMAVSLACIAAVWGSAWWMLSWFAAAWILIPTVAHYWMNAAE